MSDDPNQLQLGRLLRDQGIERVTMHADAEYRMKVDEAIMEFARSGVPFHADMVRAVVGDPPDGKFNLIPARFRAASQKKLIDKVGHTQSHRKERHAGEMKVWVGTAGAGTAETKATA